MEYIDKIFYINLEKRKDRLRDIQKELEKIYKMNEDYKPFVTHLNQLVKSLNIKKIRQFLQNHIN